LGVNVQSGHALELSMSIAFGTKGFVATIAVGLARIRGGR
jgi:hypothetical protein